MLSVLLAAAHAQPPQCPVSVERVLEDASHRGHHITPAHLAWVESLSPEEHQLYVAESHGETYRLCAYAVTVNDKLWRFTETWSTTFEDKPAGWCREAIPEVVAQIQRTTRGCTDLHAGAYYGHDLVPLTGTE